LFLNGTNEKTISAAIVCLFFFTGVNAQKTNTYSSLLQVSKDLRKLERTNLPTGIPDYRLQTIRKIQATLEQYKKRWQQIDTTGWPLEQKIDYVLVYAELNALDYNCRILQPWVRDPSFYAVLFEEQSDTPDHEGPTSFAGVELWNYQFPLTEASEKKLTAALQVIPPLMQQARINLTGNARDLWEAGIENISDQNRILAALEKKTNQSGAALKQAIGEAKRAFTELANWLTQQLPSKNGRSGIGKENYTWHLQQVLLVPYSWEEEVALLERELARSYASLQLERERNKNLPELIPFSNEFEFTKQTDLAIKKLMQFLEERKILPVKEYMEPALRQHIGQFIPEEKRNFFANISFRAPEVLYAHTTHWFEVAGLTYEPHGSEIRKGALPYNMWMQRSEGLATFMEEMLLHAGLWDDNPRARELVWIMLAQRCARGLASLYAQANLITYEEARKFQVEWTPKGWTGDESLVGFEQLLYLRQPGYGTSYVTGKYFMERLLMDMGRKNQETFQLYDFFKSFYGAGIIPTSLVRWQMTGAEDEVNRLLKNK
jgi:hypothetical protein